jgi:hypothetical protein
MNSTPRLTFQIESNYSFMPYGCRRYGATEYGDFPVRLSVPVAAGRFSPKDRLSVRDSNGQIMPGIVRSLHLWSDGSVRVWEVWMPANLKREECKKFELVTADSQAGKSPIRLLNQPSEFTITAILADGTIASENVRFDERKTGDGLEAYEDEREFELKRKDGVTLFKGALIRTSWSWYPGMGLAARVINYTPGDETMVKALTLDFDLPGRGPSRHTIKHLSFAAELMPRLFQSDQPFDVRADGGGIHAADIRQLGREQTDYAVYERGPYAASVDSWIAATDDESGLVLTVPEAVERNPKGWSIHGRHVKIELHPEWAAPLAWRRGMALYQRIDFAQLPRTASPEEFENEALRWLRPPIVTVDSEVYRAAGWRIPFLYQPERFPRTEFTIRATWEFSWTTGTFEWGDQVGANKGTLPLPRGMSIDQGVARNLEYDFVACAAKEFARTGHPELWKQCRASAEHMMHTDFVAVSDDRWQEGGIPHHCNRHTTGAAYPSHMWIEGLTLYYQLSGDRYVLKVAERVGDFFLRYIDKRWMVIEATAREMGWTLVALAAIYDMTREQRYLRGIQKVVDFYLDRGAEEFFPTDATFTHGVALIGLDRVRPFHRDADVKEFILAVLDHIMATRVDGMGIFDYNHDSERKGLAWIQTHLPEALNIGYRLSGDLKYLKAAWRLFQFHEAGAPLTVQNKHQFSDCGYAAGYHITWTMGCFASFAERGWLDKLQFADPE